MNSGAQVVHPQSLSPGGAHYLPLSALNLNSNSNSKLKLRLRFCLVESWIFFLHFSCPPDMVCVRETPGSKQVCASMLFHIFLLVIRGVKMAFFWLYIFFYFRNEVVTPKLVKGPNFKNVVGTNKTYTKCPFSSNVGVKWGSKCPFCFFNGFFLTPEMKSSPQN